MSIDVDNRRIAKQQRGRSIVAIKIREDRERNELTPEDVAERVHAWFHANWSVTSNRGQDQQIGRCQRPNLCRDLRTRAMGTLRRIEHLTQATYEKDPEKFAHDIAEMRFAVTVAHAEASIEDIYVAAMEYHRTAREERRRQYEEAKRQHARDLVAQVKSGRMEFDLLDDAQPEEIALHMLAEEMRA